MSEFKTSDKWYIIDEPRKVVYLAHPISGDIREIYGGW